MHFVPKKTLLRKKAFIDFMGSRIFCKTAPNILYYLHLILKYRGSNICMYIDRECKEQSQGRRSYDFKQPVCIFSASHVQQPLLIERSGQYISKEQKYCENDAINVLDPKERKSLSPTIISLVPFTDPDFLGSQN